jgi:hypothetical protein|tara:strand:+ start:212 stop:445 length:234 start_codon:yes stop_codon:yes gene_type:complete
MFDSIKGYYSKEPKTIHLVGYSIALALAGIGVLETAHSLPYILKGESHFIGTILGPLVIACGSIAMFGYYKEMEKQY